MKRIAFVIHSLGIGGCERALVNLINTIPESSCDITIYITEDNRQSVMLFRRNVVIRKLPLKQIKSKEIIKGSKNMVELLVNVGNIARIKRCDENSYQVKKMVCSYQDAVDDEYDFVIYYSLPTRLELVYTAEKFKAKKKIAWVHMDVSTYRGKIEEFLPVYKKYDRIICVSEYCRKQFMTIFPELKKNMAVMYNVIDRDDIDAQSMEYFPHVAENCSTIFTCSRLSPEKRPELAIQVLKCLKDKKKNVRWYWAGDGELYDRIARQVESEELQDNFVLLGPLTNPYPWYKCCDVYVQLSKSESYCLSLAEAKILKAKAVATNFQTAFEILDENDSIVEANPISISDAIVTQLESSSQSTNSDIGIGTYNNFLSILEMS